jgi:hypothetical protein
MRAEWRLDVDDVELPLERFARALERLAPHQSVLGIERHLPRRHARNARLVLASGRVLRRH